MNNVIVISWNLLEVFLYRLFCKIAVNIVRLVILENFLTKLKIKKKNCSISEIMNIMQIYSIAVN